MKYFVMILFLVGFLGLQFADGLIHDAYGLVQNKPQIEITPTTTVRYGDTFTIHAWLDSYEKPDDLRYYIDVFDENLRKVDSTLWFARQDFVYEFDTTHPSYNITKGGTYLIKAERANNIERTGIIETTLLFEIVKPDIIPPPLKQIKLGVKLGQIICDEDKTPVWNIHNKPACLTDQTYDKLLTRGWAKLRLLLPASGDPLKELEWTGQNELTMRFVGSYSIADEQPLSYDKKRQLAWEYAQKYHAGEQFLEYSITPHLYHYYLGEKIQFDLLEWGNYADCWDVKLRIFDQKKIVLYEDTLKQYCLEATTDGKPGTFHTYSAGIDFEELICEKPGYYLIEVSNGDIFPPTILQNFVCLNEEYVSEPTPEPERTLPPEPPFEKEEPVTKIEIMFGEKLNDGLVPVIVTEVTTHAESLDKIMVWKFNLIGYDASDRRGVWDIVPNDKRIWYEITNDNGQEIIDYTRMPENWAVPDDLHLYEMDCGLFHKVIGESAHPTVLLIKNNTSTIFAKNSWIGIYPDSNGDYSFEFASIFEHYVRFPEDSTDLVSQESKLCKLTNVIEEDLEGKYTEGYYKKMVFRLK